MPHMFALPLPNVSLPLATGTNPVLGYRGLHVPVSFPAVVPNDVFVEVHAAARGVLLSEKLFRKWEQNKPVGDHFAYFDILVTTARQSGTIFRPSGPIHAVPVRAVPHRLEAEYASGQLGFYERTPEDLIVFGLEDFLFYFPAESATLCQWQNTPTAPISNGLLFTALNHSWCGALGRRAIQSLA